MEWEHLKGKRLLEPNPSKIQIARETARAMKWVIVWSYKTYSNTPPLPTPVEESGHATGEGVGGAHRSFGVTLFWEDFDVVL